MSEEVTAAKQGLWARKVVPRGPPGEEGPGTDPTRHGRTAEAPLPAPPPPRGRPWEAARRTPRASGASWRRRGGGGRAHGGAPAAERTAGSSGVATECSERVRGRPFKNR